MATQRTKKGCGCLFVGWALIIVAAFAWLMGSEFLAPYGTSGYVAVGFALGVGLCCVIIGNVYVKIRNWIKKKLGRGTTTTPSSTRTTRTTNTGTTRRLPNGLPGMGGSQTTRRQSTQPGGTISNPWGEPQRFVDAPQQEESENAPEEE